VAALPPAHAYPEGSATVRLGGSANPGQVEMRTESVDNFSPKSVDNFDSSPSDLDRTGSGSKAREREGNGTVHAKGQCKNTLSVLPQRRYYPKIRR
jgi:hypothetical protein